MSYSIGATGSSAGLGPLSIDTISISGYNDSVSQPQPNFNIGVTKAHGGFIVGISANRHSTPEYHIIPENKNFDKELGKIISFHLLKRVE